MDTRRQDHVEGNHRARHRERAHSLSQIVQGRELRKDAGETKLRRMDGSRQVFGGRIRMSGCATRVTGAAELQRRPGPEGFVLMFVRERNQHPGHLLATSDRSFKCTSNGRAITDCSEKM